MLKTSTHIVRVENVPVRYQVVGEGFPLILVHGLCASTLWWRRNVQSLAQCYRVYLVDLPGFGSMRRCSTRFVLAQAASWLLQWMEAVGVKQAHLIGHSMGGYICMEVAAHRPDVVSRLVLVAPAVKPHARTVFGYILPLLIGIRYLTPLFFPILLYDTLRTGPFTLLRVAREIVRQETLKEIDTINTPTLLVWGENDTLVPPTIAPILREELANTRLLTLKRAGHVCMFDRPHEFNAAVHAFLRGNIDAD